MMGVSLHNFPLPLKGFVARTALLPHTTTTPNSIGHILRNIRRF